MWFCKMFCIYCFSLFWTLFGGTVSVSHSFLGTYTAVNTDEFTCVLWLDGEAVDSYSSNGTDSVPRRTGCVKERPSSVEVCQTP
uniref:Secreted protein n=1 Tax=Anguilla anguilla TaxID=7936 RepID=A0A0E9P604_ANGAN